MTMSTRGRRTGARTAVRIGPLLAVALVTLVVTSHAGAGTVRRKCRRTCRPLVRTCAESLPLGRVCLGRKNCVKVEETSPLSRFTTEYKYYAPGIGMVSDGEMKLVKVEKKK